jgi:endonuclease YncB( thermonuclease family)
MKRSLVAGLLLALALLAPSFAATLQGKVLRVFDGDSVEFQPEGGGKPIEVRLKDIDAPESCQPGGPEAREFLLDYVRDKTVRIDTAGRDAYGRTLAVLTVDGMNVNQRMVAEGHAWSIRTKWNQGPFVAQERMAQALKRGLHANPGAVMPGEFRRSKGPCSADGAASAPAPASAPERRSEAATPELAAVAIRCDGRMRCSQMRSCAEAKYFLANCPGVEMDGDRDGIPCEQQWCVR